MPPNACLFHRSGGLVKWASHVLLIQTIGSGPNQHIVSIDPSEIEELEDRVIELL